MSRKSLILFTLLSLFGMAARGQLVQDLYKIYDPVFGNDDHDSTAILTPFGVIKPGVSYNLSVGTSYSSFGSGMGLSETYISPMVSYSPNQKLQVVAGISFSRTGTHGLSTPSPTNINTGQALDNPYQAWAYTQYSFNNRFSVYAMGSVSQNQTYFSPYSRTLGSYNSQMYGVGFNYRISSKASIGASFNFVNRNPFGYQLGGYGNPFIPY